MMSLASLLVLTLAIGADEAPAPAPVPAPAVAPEMTDWSLTLPEAIRLGLVNSEVVRVVATGTNNVVPAGLTAASLVAKGLSVSLTSDDRTVAPPATVGPHNADLVIASLHPDASIWNFKSALMAHVRSVEQQYWAVWAFQVNEQTRAAAIGLDNEILLAAQAQRQAGRITQDALDEAEQQFAKAKLELVTAEADLATSRGQLRNILGLSAGETRRLVVVTAPTEVKQERNWEACVRQMTVAQPDIVLQREVLADSAVMEAFHQGAGDQKTDEAQRMRQRQQALLQQIVHQTTHSLARFFLEIDATQKQYLTARRIHETSGQRLATERATYNQGGGPLDRLLEAVDRDVVAANQEALYLSAYNTSIVALEEAKGTLLTYDGITVTEESSPRQFGPATPAPAEQPQAPAPSTGFKIRASVAGFKLFDVEVQKTATTPAASR